ncbi:MAG: P-loop NTPase fold protein [Solirubrobacterales bacterium]
MNKADDLGNTKAAEGVKVIPGDNPVATSSQDTLERFPVAQSFVSQVLAVDASEGAVVGVLGRWGSGKTSFINFARTGFDSQEIVILDFNPWMFSGAEQLVDSFFIELSAQLRDKDDAQLDRIASALSDYGEVFSGLAWLPVVGPWIERGRLFSKHLGKLLARRNEGIGERKRYTSS